MSNPTSIKVKDADTNPQTISTLDALLEQGAAAVAPATERSSFITTGGTAQNLFSANATRNGFEFQNLSTADMYIRDRGTAGTNVASAGGDSLWIPAGGYYSPPQVSVNAYSIFCATTNAKFYAKEH